MVKTYIPPPESILSTVDKYWRFDSDALTPYDTNVQILFERGHLSVKSWVWAGRTVTQYRLTKSGKKALRDHRAHCDKVASIAFERIKNM